MSRETDLLEAMQYATLPEQRLITAELAEIQHARTAAVQADRDTDLGVQIARDHLTPVFVHGQHTASTDWLDEVAPNFTQADLKDVDRAVRTEAANWFRRTHQAVREDQSEFIEQARGVARRTASQYGTLAPQVTDRFMTHVASLYRIAEGTDLAGVPSAADGETNPNATDWAAEPESTDAGAAPGYENPPGIEDFPEQVGDDGGSGESNPTDSSPTSAPAVDESDTLDVTDSNNAAGSTQAEVAQGTSTASYDYGDKPAVWSVAARSFLGVEEGQAIPVPGESDPEQSGEAGTTLPRSVEVSDAPETMDNFIDFNKDDPAAVSSERAKNITSTFRTAESVEDAASDENPDPDHDGDDDRPGSTDNPDEAKDEVTQVESRRIFAADEDARLDKVISDDNDDTFDPNKDDDDTKPWEKESRRVTAEEADYAAKCGRTDKHGAHMSDKGFCVGNKGERIVEKRAVATGPNPQGSFVYDAQRVIDLGYKEGYRYAVLWTPGKPVPAALSSSAQLGDKYNAEYVQGYKEGVAAAVGQMPADLKAEWARAATQVSVTAAALPQLELADMDDTPANPLVWGDGVAPPSVDGQGAADVADVKTPGASVADYPAPGGASQAPAIGEDPADDWAGQEGGAADPEKTAAFRRTVQANLRRGV